MTREMTVDPLYGTSEQDKNARRRVRDAMQRAAERNTRGRVDVSDADVHSFLFELRSDDLAVDAPAALAAESSAPERLRAALTEIAGTTSMKADCSGIRRLRNIAKAALAPYPATRLPR